MGYQWDAQGRCPWAGTRGYLGRIGVEEMGTEGRTVVHCEILEGMGVWVGKESGWMGRVGGGDSWL